ncbi:SET domain-containing protein [Plenodomus tracheiphilus IPT5]|uniref:SET domain-containing protein n=1 Tax=Plenodomus tracheiphilus IPT5 TaxID=1408161 RepID=A0A6A7BAG7_9PLEO|nr:SET domain-containing protein [Plenodomus tracheiphilus IPT5]
MDTLSDYSAPATASDSAPSTSRRSSLSLAPTTESNDTLPTGAPRSSLFEIRQTPFAGRAVFASQDIDEGTTIWRSDDLTLCVLLREYRREVCGQCFGYDYGRDLEIRDKNVGFAFCSKECRDKWTVENGEVGVQAWAAVEKLTRGRGKEDSEMVELDLPRPRSKEIKQQWESVAAQAALIRIAREGEGRGKDGVEGAVQVTKQHKKALQKALQHQITPDVMTFCLSGILWRHHHPADWDRVLALAMDKTPYHSFDDLNAFTRTYLALLAVLPLLLLPLVTSETIFALSSRDSHNSFGIRSLEDDGSEFFGYGCWPAASYFNHSCNPNVEKQREGRVWTFRAGREIAKGDELCITYLSGEERKLSRGKRMLTLKKNWGFDCLCDRCEAA